MLNASSGEGTFQDRNKMLYEWWIIKSNCPNERRRKNVHLDKKFDNTCKVDITDDYQIEMPEETKLLQIECRFTIASCTFLEMTHRPSNVFPCN